MHIEILRHPSKGFQVRVVDIASTNRPLAVAFRRVQSCPPLNERLLAEIAAVQFKQIEAIDACRHTPPVQQGKEVGE